MGTSILTNSAAMTAMKTLRDLSAGLDNVQERVSTGKRINKAADNTAYWSISSMMQSDRSTLAAASDGMKLGQKQITTANTAVNQAKKNLDQINAHLMTDYQKGDGDVKKIQNAVKGELNALKAAVASANMAEKNILGNNGETVRVAGSYRREGSATYVDMIEVGSEALNFASKNADGSFDFTQGRLAGAFAESGSDVKGLSAALDTAESDFATATSAATTAKEELATLKATIDAAFEAFNDAPAKITIQDPDFPEDPSKTIEVDNPAKDWSKFVETNGEAIQRYTEASLAYDGTVVTLEDPEEGAAGGKLTITAPAEGEETGLVADLAEKEDAFQAAQSAFKDALDGFTLEDFVNADLTGISASGLESLVVHLQQTTTDVTQNVVAAGAELGVAEKQIGDQIDFLANLMTAVDQGIGAMVDADMTAESARLASLQVQQQLGIQALSIANQNNQNLLSLFRG